MRIGVIGTNWGLMHVGGFRGAGADVVGLCGHSEEKTRRTAEREGIAFGTTDPAALIDAVDAVVVASPDALHREHAALALSRGRHVLVEKPLTRTWDEARALLEERGPGSSAVAAVNFPCRMLPPLASLRRWLQGRGAISQVQVEVANHFVPFGGEEGDLMGTSGDFGGASHYVDSALWLAVSARPAWVQAVLTGRPVHGVALHIGLETGTLIQLSHRPGAVPGIDARWRIDGPGWEAEVSGGYVPGLGGWRVGAARVFESGGWMELSPEVVPQPGAREPWAQAHVEVARAFIDAVKGHWSAALGTFEQGADVQRIFDGAMRSEQSGRRIAF